MCWTYSGRQSIKQYSLPPYKSTLVLWGKGEVGARGGVKINGGPIVFSQDWEKYEIDISGFNEATLDIIYPVLIQNRICR